MTAHPHIDLSVLLTLHSETLVAGPMIRSLEAAIAKAVSQGATVERLLALDRPSRACLDFIQQDIFAPWTRHTVDFADQGKTRNHLAKLSRGRFIAVMDGDDLCSENWLAAALDLLARPDAARTIVHPELNWIFDAGQYVYINPPSTSPLLNAQAMRTSNYFDALCVAPRAAWLDIPYADRDIANGFAFEDYQWSVECTSAAWTHAIAKDTIIFKRRRDASQTTQALRRNVLIRDVPAHAIDAGRTTGGDG